MKTRAVRLYGKKDLRLDKFDIPAPGRNEILAKVVSDSLCMSTYKAAVKGAEHKRVPDDIDVNPIIVGHEFSGIVIETGEKWKKKYPPGFRFGIQPNINYLNKGWAPGYSFPNFGGDSEYILIPEEVMEGGFLLPLESDGYYKASLAEPISCIIAAFNACYHTESGQMIQGPTMGGRIAILAGAGPMGLGALDYALHSGIKPKQIIVTDINIERIDRAKELFNSEQILQQEGVDLQFVNTNDYDNAEEYLMELTGGEGFNDVFVFAPVRPVIEIADKILAFDGCLNFFAGPVDPKLSAEINFYNVHYAGAHILGTSGGSTEDMREALRLINSGEIDPSVMITHVGGLDSAVDTTLNLPSIPGGKKLIYPSINMPLTEVDKLEELESEFHGIRKVHEVVMKNKKLWTPEAEALLLKIIKC